MDTKLVMISSVLIIGLIGLGGLTVADTTDDVDYSVYDGEDWALTDSEDVVEKDDNVTEMILDLGTRTEDGSMHVYIQSTVPDSTYDIEVSEIYKYSDGVNGDEHLNIEVETVENDNDFGSQAIEYPEKYIEMTDITQEDIEDVTVEITMEYDEVVELSRDACGCVLGTDPVPE